MLQVSLRLVLMSRMSSKIAPMAPAVFRSSSMHSINLFLCFCRSASLLASSGVIAPVPEAMALFRSRLQLRMRSSAVFASSISVSEKLIGPLYWADSRK